MPAHAGGSSLGNLDFDNQDYELCEQLHDLDEQDPEPYERQQGKGAFMNTASRYSLAFELASALEPSSDTTADLMAELGIEEDGQDIHRTHNDLSFVSEHDEALDGLLEHDAPLSSAKSTPLRRTRRPESQASLRESRNIAMSPAPAEEDDSTAEAALASANQSIQSFLAETDVFVRLLNTLNGTAESTEAQLASLPTERQFPVEKLVSTLTEALYELAKRREDQIKELKDIESAIGDPDPAWQMSLAEVEPLPAFQDFSSPDVQYTTTLEDVQEEDEDDETQAATIRLPQNSHNSASPRNPLLPELAHLRNTTDLLIASLSSVADQTHVGKATNTGISRKLKSMQGALTGMRQEAESVERSIEYVRHWEEKEFGANSISNIKVSALPTITPRRRKTSASSSILSTSSASSTGTARKISGSYSERVRGEMKAAFSLLETCHERARVLLSMAT